MKNHMVEALVTNLENIFDPDTVANIVNYAINNDKRLKSITITDTRRNLRETYKRFLRALAKHSDPHYGPRMNSRDLAESVTPVNKDKYTVRDVITHCANLEKENVLARTLRDRGENIIWTYLIPIENLPEECQEVLSLINNQGIKLENIAENVDMKGDRLERTFEILKYQQYSL